MVTNAAALRAFRRITEPVIPSAFFAITAYYHNRYIKAVKKYNIALFYDRTNDDIHVGLKHRQRHLSCF